MKSMELGDWTDRPVAWPHATPSASSTETLAYRPFSTLAETDAKPLNRPRLRAGGAARPLALCRRSCLSLTSGQSGAVWAAWAMPKRVPARGRGRETELSNTLSEAGTGNVD